MFCDKICSLYLSKRVKKSWESLCESLVYQLEASEGLKAAIIFYCDRNLLYLQLREISLTSEMSASD